MKSLLTLLPVVAVLASPVGDVSPDLRALTARVSALESRVSALESPHSPVIQQSGPCDSEKWIGLRTGMSWDEVIKKLGSSDAGKIERTVIRSLGINQTTIWYCGRTAYVTFDGLTLSAWSSP